MGIKTNSIKQKGCRLPYPEIKFKVEAIMKKSHRSIFKAYDNLILFNVES